MRGSIGSVNIGGSSILVIFVLLCLTTFATLAMVSAVADHAIATRMEAFSDGYFAASNRAEEVLSEINQVINTIPHENLETELPLRFFEVGVAFEQGIISYSIPIDDVLSIDVELEFNGEGLRVISWIMGVNYDADAYGAGGMRVWPGN